MQTIYMFFVTTNNQRERKSFLELLKSKKKKMGRMERYTLQHDCDIKGNFKKRPIPKIKG